MNTRKVAVVVGTYMSGVTVPVSRVTERLKTPLLVTDSMADEITQAGLAILEEEDITPNVLAALRKDSERRLALIERSVNRRLVGTFKEFAAIAGSRVFEEFSDGRLSYLRYTLRKPQPAGVAA